MRAKLLGHSLFFGILVALLTSLQPIGAQDTPWKRRLRTGVVLNDSPEVQSKKTKGPLTVREMLRLGLRPRGAGLRDLSQWPEEPAAPARVSPRELADALAKLCPESKTRREIERYARAIVRYSIEFSVDPWVLAALVYTQSNCSPDVDTSYGTGLTLINEGMHSRNVQGGAYRFGVWTERGWLQRTLDVGAFPFHRRALRNPEANLYHAAAQLRLFTEQCPRIDAAFDSVRHRHPVSHFIWGDQVNDTGPEDRILTARRRLLNSHAQTRKGGQSIGGLALVSPLDGYPRVATSGLGEPRDNGRRPHRGIDFASDEGEPVRSVAAGVVTFAGVDWERRAQIPLEPWGAALVHDRHMGPRGLFVEVDHGGGVVSLYAHLASYGVQVGDRVEAGQRLGEVGRTGVRDSGAHLHFGLFKHGAVLDPLDYLAAFVYPPNLTKRGIASLSRPQSPEEKTSRRRRRR
jgi:murein DD-endopeptidase MepM/ murein hydrolase activator NlpD